MAVLAALIGYLLGSLSFARLVGRFVAPGDDVAETTFAAQEGERPFVFRSASATSILVRAGPRMGCLTSVLDMLKVTLPTLAFRRLYPGEPYFLVAAAAGVIGHNWPVYYRFRGGRGASPIFGGMWVIDALGGLVTSLAGMVLGIAICRDMMVSYVTGFVLLIPWLWWRTRDWTYVAYAVVVCVSFVVALLPELRQYVALKRAGRVEMADIFRESGMGRGLGRMGHRLGLIKPGPEVVERREE
jgi:glycerol-3-phosphate acyltransferase PlsY